MKTVGLVQLPGMMTGLILAGVAPTEAIKYQIMVTFMLTGAVVTASYAAAYQAYQGFFGLYGSVRQGTGD
jgi:putative ABC transport system permease protein